MIDATIVCKQHQKKGIEMGIYREELKYRFCLL